jgi:hypothetical protein
MRTVSSKKSSKRAFSAASVLLTAIASLSSASAWSESYIYLTNNTDQTLDLTVNQRGSSLTKGDHWKQHATSIPPYGTARYLEINRVQELVSLRKVNSLA